MREQLQSFRVTDATCHCCTVDHRGGAMHCDREVIQQCLVQWFGSIENFEKSVQTNVSEALLHQLGYFSFPISWMLACAAPVTWSFLPYAIQEPLFGTLFIFAWTFAVPTIFMIASSSSYLLRRPRASRLGDAVVNVACVFMCAGSYLAMESYVGLLSATLNYWQGILTFASTMLLAMAAAYGSWAGCGAYGRCLWARSSGRFGDVEDSSATDEWCLQGLTELSLQMEGTCSPLLFEALDLEPPNETLLERFGHLLVNFAWQPALPPAQGALPQDEDDAANGYETDEEGPASASETHP
eukprot:g11946.t1